MSDILEVRLRALAASLARRGLLTKDDLAVVDPESVDLVGDPERAAAQLDALLAALADVQGNNMAAFAQAIRQAAQQAQQVGPGG